MTSAKARVTEERTESVRKIPAIAAQDGCAEPPASPASVVPIADTNALAIAVPRARTNALSSLAAAVSWGRRWR